MHSGMSAEDPNQLRHMMLAELRALRIDVMRLQNTQANRHFVNQSNQPGGGFESSSPPPSSSSTPPSSSSWPPECPDGDCTTEPPIGCCAYWRWYGSVQGWVCLGASNDCDGWNPCTGTNGSTYCPPAEEPSADGEYIGQFCETEFLFCSPGSSSSPPPPPPPECEFGFCWFVWDGVEWTTGPLFDSCIPPAVCPLAGDWPAGEYIGEVRYECCQGANGGEPGGEGFGTGGGSHIHGGTPFQTGGPFLSGGDP